MSKNIYRKKSEHIRYQLPKFFLENMLTYVLFGYITARVEQGGTIKEAAHDFQTLMSADENDLSIEAILMCYNRSRENFTMYNRYDAKTWFENKGYHTKAPPTK